ncbi:MAG TPA: hypothetical protein VFN78_15035 [Ktedonobacterales bacterium]|nr:hypothetical protein [Ktedonobacterales bacterium]
MLTERNQALDTPTLRPHPRATLQHWRDPLAAVATVLLIALAASVFAFMSGRNAGTGSGHHANHVTQATATPSITRVTAIQPSDTLLPMPRNAYLSDLSFSSAHDGWAVGGIRIPDLAGQDFSAQHGILIHYHDGVWTTSSESLPGMSLSSVSMVAADEGWAVGMTVNPPDNSGGVAVLLHYTGGHWVSVNTPALAGIIPDTIRMLSPDIGYIVGVANEPSKTYPGSVEQLTAIVVYQNGAWQATRTPFAAYQTQVVMVSASEGWANTSEVTLASGGVSSSQATLYHYLHGSWTKSLTIPGHIISMSASSPSDVWALASECGACSEPTVRIERYNGATWEQVNPPSASDGIKIPGFGIDTIPDVTLYNGAASGVWMVYVTQDKTTTMWVYGLNGNNAWQSASPAITNGVVWALTGDGNGGIWALSQIDSPLSMTVLYTQGNDWQVYGHS